MKLSPGLDVVCRTRGVMPFHPFIGFVYMRYPLMYCVYSAVVGEVLLLLLIAFVLCVCWQVTCVDLLKCLFILLCRHGAFLLRHFHASIRCGFRTVFLLFIGSSTV